MLKKRKNKGLMKKVIEIILTMVGLIGLTALIFIILGILFN